MARKKPLKSEASTKSKAQKPEDSWRTALEAIEINGETWWCIVTMMVETIVEHSRCVSLFNAGVEQGKRKAIYSLSCQKTLATVRSLSKQDPDSCPVVQTVCHYASKVLSENNDVLPTWLMARVVKYLIYRAKEESIGIEKRKEELEREIDEEYQVMQSVLHPDQTAGRTQRTMEGAKSSKANTRLRKRDEEWRDAVYVDDAPINGPNFYVILTGFHDPNLPTELITSGVPLSCILSIEGSNEDLEAPLTQLERESLDDGKLRFFKTYGVDEIELREFWRTIEGYLEDPEGYPAFRDVAFLKFQPPGRLEVCRDECEQLKEDVYDGVSCAVYDFYDLFRQHGNYLKCMKVVTSIADEGKEKCDVEVYQMVLDLVPQDCLTVPVVLCAMLLQVEANDGSLKFDEAFVEEKPATAENFPEEDNGSPLSIVEKKLQILNRKYGLEPEYNPMNDETEEQLDLILHGDDLNRVLYSDVQNKPKILSALNLTDNILRVLCHPRITEMWNNNEPLSNKKINHYTHHLDKIRLFFDIDISEEELMHSLHLLIFNKMMLNEDSPDTDHPNRDIEVQHIHSNVKEAEEDAGNSSTSLSSHIKPRSESAPVSNLNTRHKIRSQSENDVHKVFEKASAYSFTSESLPSKPASELIQISSLNLHHKILSQSEDNVHRKETSINSPLFDLIDPREALVPGYLKSAIEKGTLTSPMVEEFSKVEPLSRQVLLQTLHKCLLSFDKFETRYFEATDSILICFSNDTKAMHMEEAMSSIRTPVGLREFCQYVASEEKEWIEREKERYRVETTRSTGRLMKISEKYDETMIFHDGHFILPGSLKAREQRSDFVAAELPVVRMEKDATKRRGEKEDAGKKKAEREDAKKKKETKGRGKGQKSAHGKVERSETEVDVSSIEGKSTARSEDEVTYEFIGYDLGRLRVQVTNNKKRFVLDDGTRVMVETEQWLYDKMDLRIVIERPECYLRFSRRIGSVEDAEVFHLMTKTGIILAFCKGTRNDWPNISFDFRASWPSGLLIEPITGDGPENPFYIRQSYIPKYRGNGEVHEICRKFLRNGTVLKYISDGTIIVLQSNGVIATCVSLKKLHQDKKVNDDSTPLKVASVKVSRYTLLNHDGRLYDVLDDSIVSEHHRLLVRTASDYEVDEKFTRREDGTDMLLNSNGELIVSFPDGTRITTGFTIEEEPVMCDWTEEEISRYFISGGTVETGEYCHSTSSSYPKFPVEVSSRTSTGYESEMTEILIAESFVSVLLTCRSEHKNYATVFYDQSAVNCTLSMPDDLRVSISRSGHYRVSMAADVNLKITEDSLTLHDTSHPSESTSTYFFTPCDVSLTIFTITDLSGTILEVKGDGTTRYHPRSRPSASSVHRKFTSSVLDTDANKSETHGIMKNESTEDERRKNDDDRCNREIHSDSIRYRIFSTIRDLTGYEYLHRSILRGEELPGVFGTSLIVYPISRRPELRRLITFEPLELEPRSKAALSSFRPDGIKPTNYDRRHLLRSTYTIPYDWCFPFGKNGDGIWKNTHDIPLAENLDRIAPELLKIRVVYDFKEAEGHAIIDLQRAMGRYWLSLASGTPSQLSPTEGKRSTSSIPLDANLQNLENDLRDLAHGIKSKIDVSTYRLGLDRIPAESGRKARGKSIEFVERLEQRSSKRLELEWYKDCLRKGIVLPYFKNIAGTCFLWVKDCAEEALKILRISLSTFSMYEMEESDSKDLDGEAHRNFY